MGNWDWEEFLMVDGQFQVLPYFSALFSNNMLNNIEPKALWDHFSALNAIPRASKKEAQIIQFMLDFGNSLGLPTIKDVVGNVIIKKPATQGMENRPTLVLQSHLDMVHQKNADTQFDFATQGIDMYIDGDWVRAHGTTLGADNGIGVASIMALLSSTDIPHPALEALFTIDEETGMTGAKGLEAGVLNGDILLNLDTEDDRELCIGCAGGIDVSGLGTYAAEPVPSNWKTFTLTVNGLTGGHSGMDIHLGRANANKLMTRTLKEIQKTIAFRLVKFDGGSLRNAIPREAVAVIAIPGNESSILANIINDLAGIFSTENLITDPQLLLSIAPTEAASHCLPDAFTKTLIGSLYTIPNGIYRMTPGIDGLVQSSNNLARVLVQNETYEIHCLCRSSVDSEKLDLTEMIVSALEFLNGETQTKGEYPGWAPLPNSAIVKLMQQQYESMFNEKPHVNAVHAGLECGILGINYPQMQMISFGPNIRGAHSPDECVQISSVQKFWKYLLEVIANIKEA